MVEQEKKDIKQNLINSADALAAAAKALMEAAKDLQKIEDDLADIESHIIEQEQIKQRITSILMQQEDNT